MTFKQKYVGFDSVSLLKKLNNNACKHTHTN